MKKEKRDEKCALDFEPRGIYCFCYYCKSPQLSEIIYSKISAIALKKDEFYVESNNSTKSIIIFVILYEFGCFLLSLYGIGIHSRRPDRSPGKKLFRIHSSGALILVGSSCTLVASGGWLLYQNQLATNFGRRKGFSFLFLVGQSQASFLLNEGVVVLSQ